MTRSSLREAWSRLVAHNSFVLACHERPDGDCLGAALALARVLKGLGKDVTTLCQDPVPEHYLFLPEAGTIAQSTDRRGFDVGVVVDCDQPHRTGNVAEIINSAKTSARIDHHLSNADYGDIQVVETKISSTSELIIELFEANDIAIDKHTATMLLTGIIFDTGGFRYSNATSRTFQIVSQFAAMGIRPSRLVRAVFESRSLKSAQLLGRALCSMEAVERGQIVIAQLAYSDYLELGVEDSDSEGIVNSVAAIKGPRVVILLREAEQGVIRVSLRSRDGFDVSMVASAFGGGGHAVASGCTIEGTLEHARAELISEVRQWMES
ncbi:MAG: DHH family phosphoesterase [Armatimonadota bacterium]